MSDKLRFGLIGCGNMGRRLISYLKPFNVDLWVHDPYLPTLTFSHTIYAICQHAVLALITTKEGEPPADSRGD